MSNPYEGMTTAQALRHLAKRYLRKAECVELVLRAADEIEADWQPIETAPRAKGSNDRGPMVLLANETGVWIGRHHPIYTSGYRPDNPWTGFGLNGNTSWRPTHWMPLPEPPKK